MKKDLLTIILQPEGTLARIQVAHLFKDALLLLERYSVGDALGVVKQGLNLVQRVEQGLQAPSVAHRSFELLGHALLYACLVNLRRKSDLRQITALQQKITPPFEALSIEWTAELFEAPDQLPFLQDFKPLYRQWLLEVVDLPEHRVEVLVRDFEVHFLDAIALAWTQRPDYYQPIQTHFNHPFVARRLAQAQKRQYQEHLKNAYMAPTFQDRGLLLGTIYIAPDYQVYKQHSGFGDRQADLHQHILAQLQGPAHLARKPLLLLLGQPGQGKTSFCHRLVYDLLEDADFNKAVYWVPFRAIEDKETLIQKPFEVFKAYLKEEHDLDHVLAKDQALVLVLDGLDELYMSHGLTNNDLRTLYGRLQQRLQRRPQWTIVLTSRHHYLNPEALHSNSTAIYQLAPLNLEQQLVWLQKYQQRYPKAALTAQQLDKVAWEETLKHIKELVEQPLLLHMIARTEMDLDQITSKAALYKTLFDTVIDKNTEAQKGDRYLPLQTQRACYRHWLQEVAYTIYQSDQLFLSYETIEGLKSTKMVHHSLKDTPNELQEALKDLLVTFYFQRSATNQPAVEFLHQSLQEYLTIEYVLRTLQEELLDETGAPLPHLPPERPLELFHGWFAQKGLSENLHDLLVEQVEDLEIQRQKGLRQVLKQGFGLALHHSFLYQHHYNPQSTKPLMRQMAHTFEAYWAVLARLAPADNGDLLLKGSEEQLLFCEFLKLPYEYHPLFLQGVNLSRVNLIGVNLEGGDLSEAVLDGADLRCAVLVGVNFIDSSLRHANLSLADLDGANLSDAILYNTTLTNSNLDGAALINTNLRNANLRNVNLRNANLSISDLSGAILSNAILKNTILNGVLLGNTILSDAILHKVTFINAYLINVNFTNADLNDIDLSHAILGQLDLSSVTLDGITICATKIDSLDFCQTLKMQNCIGIEDLEKHYFIDPTPQYEAWDEDQEHPYYLIKEK